MSKYTWKKETVPNGLQVKQIYGIAFSKDGQVLLRIEDGRYKLTGGKPEIWETTYEETLKREYLEEVNIELEDMEYLGYLYVEEEEIKPYAQVRMIAKIKEIKEPVVDIATGKVYKRFLANMDKVRDYLNYSDVAGNEMIRDALALAKEKYKFAYTKEEYFV